MLGADLVAFQTYAYARHFVSSCVRVCGYESVGSMGPDSVMGTEGAAITTSGGGGNGIGGNGSGSGNGMGIDVQGRVTAVGYCPVGVDAERIERDV